MAGRGFGLRIPAARKAAEVTAAVAGAMAGGLAGPAAGANAAPAVTYWRRRFVVLAVGLATLAAAAWSLSEALRVHPGLTAPARTTHGSLGGGAGPRGGGSPSGRQGGATRHRHTAGAPGTGGTPSHTGHKPGTAHAPRPAPKPSVTAGGFGGFKPAFCSWHSIVLSLSATQASFGPGQQPNFSLSVVSTQPKDCSFNVGRGHLALVIKEGPARLWSSADCISGTGNLVMALSRGVPTVVAIGWNKVTSSPGCAGPARSVPAGSYTAFAVDGGLVSAPVTFRVS